MKKTVFTALAAVMVASVAVPAIAAQDGKKRHGGPRIERMMERFDANKDGTVELEEIAARRAEMFESADADNSGTLNAEELSMMSEIHKAERQKARAEKRADREKERKEMRAERKGKKGEDRRSDRRGGPGLERLDTDKNGEVSVEEFAAMEAKMFERFDRNGDKKIDITDFYRGSKN